MSQPIQNCFDQYTRRCTLTRVKTSNMGTLYELEYAIVLPENAPPKAFLVVLRCRNAATGGFGIGLSIARGIAEAHRGSICARMVGEEVEFAAELR